MDVIGILIGADLEVGLQLEWATRLAESCTSDLVVFHHVGGKEDRVVDVSLDEDEGAESSSVTSDIMQFILSAPGVSAAPREKRDEENGSADESHVVHLRLREIQCASLGALRRRLLVEVRKNKLKKLTIVRKELQTTDVEVTRERRIFLRHVPCEVVFCYGLQEGIDQSRILVAIGSGPHGAAALQLAADLSAHAGKKLTALRVNPGIGQDAEGVGARRLSSALKQIGRKSVDVEQRVVVDDQVYVGLRRVWEEGRHDLVVLGASKLGFFGSQIGRGLGGRLLKGEAKPAVAVVSAGSPVANRLLWLIEGAVERFVPQIDRENRVALVDRIQSSSSWNFDFLALMVLSTVIAAIGLMQDSAAVVIGAMLVAPLMTPLLGMGLALMQGNPIFARVSFRLIVLGLGVSLMVGALVGLATPGFDEPTREMLGRGGPGLLDLFIAFASGLAAAYASSRPGLLAALPGVAIAAALVPPIATSGLAISIGDFHLAAGALLLFVINMVTIVLASMVSLWFVGLRGLKPTSRWTVFAGGGFLVAAVALGVYVSVQPKKAAASSEIPAGLVVTVQEKLGSSYKLDSIAVAHDELGAQLIVGVVGKELVPEELTRQVRALARSHFSQPVRVRLVTEVEVRDTTD